MPNWKKRFISPRLLFRESERTLLRIQKNLINGVIETRIIIERLCASRKVSLMPVAMGFSAFSLALLLTDMAESARRRWLLTIKFQAALILI
jgi:hypothetical protein